MCFTLSLLFDRRAIYLPATGLPICQKFAEARDHEVGLNQHFFGRGGWSMEGLKAFNYHFVLICNDEISFVDGGIHFGVSAEITSL